MKDKDKFSDIVLTDDEKAALGNLKTLSDEQHNIIMTINEIEDTHPRLEGLILKEDAVK